MPTTTTTTIEPTATVDAIKERLAPAIETLDESVRQGRRMLVRGRHAAEDAIAAAELRVRRHPLGAVAAAAGAGAFAGVLLGFAVGLFVRPAR